MDKPDIDALAKLSRLELTQAEKQRYEQELTDILAYVEQVREVTGEEELAPEYDETKVKNVLREDSEPHSADRYTQAMLTAAPRTDGRYIKVKKIL